MPGRLLFLEPDPYEIGFYTKLLSGLYQVHFVSTPEHLVTWCRSCTPDVIILDLDGIAGCGISPSVPGESVATPGDDFFEEIRRRCGFRIPLVVVTTRPGLDYERLVRQKRIFYYLVKPFEFRLFESMLQAAYRYLDDKKRDDKRWLKTKAEINAVTRVTV